jgi:cell division protein FtsQ
MNEQLRPIGLEIRVMRKSDRHALSLELAGGLRLLLGNRDPESRLQRFLDHWPRLKDRGVAEQLDLRYAHGFSVRWSEQVADKGGETGMEG